MKKTDVQTHCERYGHRYPAINVKVYNLPSTEAVVDRFKCSRNAADKALAYAFTGQQRDFWENIEEIAKHVFGEHVQVYSEGRCGGWLVVHNLSDLETWDAIDVSKWARFVKLVKWDIEFRISEEVILDSIDVNEWYKDGSEEYNFVDSKDGVKCIADLKAEARAAGFSAVVRG